MVRWRRSIAGSLVGVLVACAVPLLAAAPASAAAPAVIASGGAVGPFVSTSDFVRQQYLDFAAREPSASELAAATGALKGGTTTPGAVVAGLAAGTGWISPIGQVTRLYSAYFLRSPDTSGLAYWLGQVKAKRTLTSISAYFSGSAEFKARYGSLSNAAFVALIYTNVLGRPGEPGGTTFWVSQLDTKARTRGQVMVGFSEAKEYKALMASQVTVTALDYGMLRALPNPKTGGVKADADDLAAGGTVPALATEILSGDAYAQRLGVTAPLDVARTASAANGTPQASPVGTGFVAPLQVRVQDGAGKALASVGVTFITPETGPSAVFGSGLRTARAFTNASGLVSAPVLTANATTGTFQAKGVVDGVVVPVLFDLTVLATGSPVGPPPTTLPATTKLLPSSAFPAATVVDANSVTFPAGTSPGLAVGDVALTGVAPGSPAGLLRKVTAVSTAGGKTTVTTEDAALSDAVPNGSLAASVPLDADQITSVTDLETGQVTESTPTRQPRFKVGPKKPIVVSIKRSVCQGSLSIVKTCPSGKAVEIALDGSITVTPRLDLTMAWHPVWGWNQADGLTLGLDASLNEDAVAKVGFPRLTGTKTWTAKRDLYSYKFAPIDIQVGPVPVVFVPTLTIYVSADGTVGLKTEISASQHLGISAGFAYKDGKLSSHKTLERSFSAPKLDASVSADGRVAAGVRVAFKLYNWDGPYIDGSAGILGHVSTKETPWWTVKAQLKLVAGLKFKIFGKGLDENVALYDKKWLLLSSPAGSHPPAIPLTIGGGPQTLEWPNQSVAQFTGTAGTTLGLGVQSAASGSTGSSSALKVVSPTGKTVCSDTYLSVAFHCSSLQLTESGPHTITYENGAATSGSIAVQLSTSKPLAIGGGTQTLGWPAQNTAQFTGTAGATLGFGVRGALAGSTGSGSVLRLYSPNGEQIWSNAYIGVGPGGGSLRNLPATGTYTVVYSNGTGTTDAGQPGSITVQLTTPKALTVGGGAQTLAWPTQNTAQFTATAGSSIGLGVRSTIAGSTGSGSSLQVYSPTGAVVFSNSYIGIGPGGGSLKNLPATGTYTIVYSNGTGQDGSITVQLSLPKPITIGGGAQTLAWPTQNTAQFTGAAGATVGLGVLSATAGSTGSGSSLQVYSPTGAVVFSNSYISVGSGGGSFTLPTTGTYTVVYSNGTGQDGNITVQLAAAKTLTVGGAAQTLTWPTQPVAQFTGTAGTTVTLAITGDASSTGNSSSLVVRSPTGTTVCSDTIIGSSSSCGTLNLTATGTYTITYSNGSGNTGTITAQLT